jgi:polysaccharide biosynthesis transport protein
MADPLDEQTSGMPDIQRYVDIVKRRHFHLLISLFVGWALVWGASWVLPPKYKSTTLILVQQPTMPANYVQPNVSGDLQDRLESISQQILSRTRLLTIIEDLHLYEGTKATADDKVARMRKDITIDLVRDARTGEINSFRVSYIARDPHVAQNVTTALTNLFISENLRQRQAESEGTTKFIETQLEEARAHLADQEAKVRAFQSAHMGDLPSQQQSNLQILSGLQSQLESEQSALNTARQQRVYLQALAEQNKLSGNPAATPRSTDPALAALDLQLTQMRAQLVDYNSRYTDKYPDVVRLKEQIARTEKQRSDLAARLGTDSGASGSEAGTSGGTAYSQLQGQLRANQLEISNRERAIASFQERINEYQGRLNGAPATEQQMAELTRGYDQSKASYDDLLKKKNESAMATSMEQMQQGARFSVLDPPSLPIRPDFPDHLKFCGFGLLAGVILGVVVVGAFEWFDDRMYDEKEIKVLLSMAIVSEIPQMTSPADEERTRRIFILKWATTGAVFLIILAGAAVSVLHV